ncbi:sugar transporter domain-containing protein [Ditylenchus destructor]|nr:sugar transporter domain-containing protein [Ditylenchus destructor]
MMLKDKLRAVGIAFTLSLSCNFQYGFSSTYLNSPVEEFRIFLNESAEHRGIQMDEGLYRYIWNMISNIWFIGFFFGVWLSPIINDRFGRKVGFLLNNVINVVASLLRFAAIISLWPELLLVGRLLASIATAVTYQSLILYLQVIDSDNNLYCHN